MAWIATEAEQHVLAQAAYTYLEKVAPAESADV